MEILTAIPFGGAAAGADKEIQFNDGGHLKGDEDLTWDPATKTFTVNGVVDVSDGIY